MVFLKLLIGLPLLLVVLPIKLITILLGYVVIPVAIVCKAYEMTDPNLSKPDDGPIFHFTWKWMKPWDNHTDGIANQNYSDYKSMFMKIMYWSAWRNPANGLRQIEPTSFVIEPSKVKFVGSDRPINKFKDRTPHWYIAWHGPYISIFWQHMIFGQLRRLWIGYKILPQDQLGVAEDDYRKLGSSITFQYKQIHIK